MTKPCRTWLSHVEHPCHTHKYVMVHVWMSHMKKRRGHVTHEWVTSHIWWWLFLLFWTKQYINLAVSSLHLFLLRFVFWELLFYNIIFFLWRKKQMNKEKSMKESWQTYEWVMSYMRLVIYVIASCVIRMNDSYHTYAVGLRHSTLINESCHTH